MEFYTIKTLNKSIKKSVYTRAMRHKKVCKNELFDYKAWSNKEDVTFQFLLTFINLPAIPSNVHTTEL